MLFQSLISQKLLNYFFYKFRYTHLDYTSLNFKKRNKIHSHGGLTDTTVRKNTLKIMKKLLELLKNNLEWSYLLESRTPMSNQF